MSIEMEHIKDCERIKVNLLSVGIERTIQQCYNIWKEVTEKVGVGWLELPEKDSLLWAELRPLVTFKLPEGKIGTPKEFALELYTSYSEKYSKSFHECGNFDAIVKSLSREAVNLVVQELESYGRDSDELQNMEWYWRYYDSVIECIDKI